MKNSLLKNSFYNTSAGAIRIGLGILTIPLLIRLIGVEEYGLWTLASTVVGTVGLAEAGLSVATTVFVSQDLSKEDVDGLSQTLTVTFGAMFILATLAAIALWFNAASIINLFPKLEKAQQLIAIQALQIGGLVVWTRLLQQVLVGVEQAYQRYDLMNMLNTIHSVLVSLGILIIAWLGGKTYVLMQWQAFISIGILLAHLWVGWLLIRGLNLSLIWNNTKGFAISRYSAGTWLTSLGGVLFTQVDRLIVGALLGTGVLGVYAAITSITAQINTFSALPVQPLLPTLSHLMVKKDIDQTVLQEQVKQALQINSLVALGMGSVLLTLAPLILHVMLSSESSYQFVLVFRIATMIYALYSVNAVGFYVCFGANAVTTCMSIQLVSGVVSLLLITIGANTFGLIGAIAGNAGYIGTLFLTFFGMKKLHIPYHLWMEWLKFPLLWFISILLTSIFISDRFCLKIYILILQILMLVIWFINVQPTVIKLFNQKSS